MNSKQVTIKGRAIRTRFGLYIKLVARNAVIPDLSCLPEKEALVESRGSSLVI